MRQSLVTAAIALVISVLAGACDSDPSSPETPPPSSAVTDRSEQDMTFARQLIPHLSQVRDLAKLVPARTVSSTVLDLAARIRRSQNPDIQQLMVWLDRWGDKGMPGTDSEAVHKLEQAGDMQFVHMWTQLTIERHQSAIALAKAELANGRNPAARQFAQKIIDTRQAEIIEMQTVA
jgi:uncharacterized protein (DUF305 family)